MNTNFSEVQNGGGECSSFDLTGHASKYLIRKIEDLHNFWYFWLSCTVRTSMIRQEGDK